MDKPIPQLEEWLNQLMEVADAGDLNILFFKITRTGTFIGYDATIGFKSMRHIEYIDQNGNKWHFTELNSFFEFPENAELIRHCAENGINKINTDNQLT